MVRHLLYQLINPRKRITVLRASFIKVGKVDADSPLVILFLQDNKIGEPVRVERLSKEANLKQAVNLITYGTISLFVHFPRFPLHFLSTRFDGELTVDDVGVNSRHIGGEPRIYT